MSGKKHLDKLISSSCSCVSLSKNGFSVTKIPIDIVSCNAVLQQNNTYLPFFCISFAALAEHQGNPLLLLPSPVLSSLAAALGAEHLVVALDSDEEEGEEDTETERLAELAKGMHQVEEEKHAMCETYHSHNSHVYFQPESSQRNWWISELKYHFGEEEEHQVELKKKPYILP